MLRYEGLNFAQIDTLSVAILFEDLRIVFREIYA